MANSEGRESCRVKKAAGKQLHEVKYMTGESAGKVCWHFNTREFGLVERVEKERGEERKDFI